MTLHFRALTVAGALLLPGCVAAKTAPAPPMNAYATKVKYTLNQNLTFPDFTLRYTGQHTVVPKPYPPGFIYYNFMVTKDQHTQKVSWTSGTGDIGPEPFSIAGKNFALELRSSDDLGKLADDELVISLVPAS